MWLLAIDPGACTGLAAGDTSAIWPAEVAHVRGDAAAIWRVIRAHVAVAASQGGPPGALVVEAAWVPRGGRIGPGPALVLSRRIGNLEALAWAAGWDFLSITAQEWQAAILRGVRPPGRSQGEAAREAVRLLAGRALPYQPDEGSAVGIWLLARSRLRGAGLV